ncbi:cytochrome b [Chryseobacterium viscerum]|uniref:Cytochrome b561 bacterial/Ni-hydrogenase domain-containing protein n=1 Tax=Chryseobacterium viscerum TaxID=1037377 RepID=A0A316WMW5_9FLAO|nr:cytochrome b/b6 domain-containing protein [Chryseobacterium viscerum]KAB1231076.1 hypothetical protein F8D52_08370 [Chryseobacterium viscerum]PWN62537.1 hypothetical protein C1634_007075 [Chryseobacterium viscerum]
MKKIIKNNLSEKYSKGTIIIHWISLVLIILLLPTGFLMQEMKAEMRLNLLRVHTLFGILIFVLTLIRILFFFRNQRPSKLETGSSFHNKLVVWIESSFYYLLIFLCLSGITTLITSNLTEAIQNSEASLLPKKLDTPPLITHRALAILLIVLLIVHIGGVVTHYLKNKENTLKRILP